MYSLDNEYTLSRKIAKNVDDIRTEKNKLLIERDAQLRDATIQQMENDKELERFKAHIDELSHVLGLEILRDNDW